MSHVPHELAEAFPEFTDMMHELKQSDAHFARLSQDYHEVNRAVHRAETNIEPTSDEHMAELRKRRMQLRDEVYAYLKQAEQTKE